MKISHVSEMRALDSQAVKKYGIKEELLMENAGLAAFNVIMNEIGIKNKVFTIFCGGGNNGGDGLMVARKIHSQGGYVKVFLLSDPSKFKGAAKLNMDIAKKLKLDLINLNMQIEAIQYIRSCDAIIDAIFGTGLDRSIEGKYDEIITLINQSGRPVYSLDIPSGINGDTGKILGNAVSAHQTITFGLPKLGNILYPGFEKGGKLSVTHISFPPELYNQKKLKIEINDPVKLPPRLIDTHKGDCGKVLFIAGSSLYLGAPYFAAESFLSGRWFIIPGNT